MPLGFMVNYMPPERTAAWVRRADEAGFDEIWVEGGLVHLTAAVMSSRRATVGSGILTAWVHEPAVVAQSAAQLAGLSDGRLRLGIGANLNPALPFLTRPPAVDHGAPRMAEYIELLRRYWSGEKGRFEGRFWQAEIQPYVPAHPIPVYVGALTETMMEMAGAVADGVAGIPFWPQAWARHAIRPAVDRGAAKAGRSERVPISGWVFTAIGPDRAQCRRDVAAYMAVALFNQRIMPLARYMGWEAAFVAGREKLLAGDRAGAAEVFTDDMIDAVAITGRPDQAREQLTGWAEVYDTPVLFAPSGPRTDDYLQRALETFAI